jgi:hypothetical protein
MLYQFKPSTGLIRIISLILISCSTVINSQFLDSKHFSSLVREYIVLDSSKLPANPTIFLGDTSYFPWDKRNQWQYFYENVNGPPGYPEIFTNKFVSEYESNGKLYRNYSYFPRSNLFIRYNSKEQKVYIWNDSVALNFVAPNNSMQNIYCLFMSSMTNYLVKYSDVTRWGQTFREQSYSDMFSFGFAKGIGYSFYSEPYGWPWPCAYLYVAQAKIYDSIGVALYYNPAIKPSLVYNPQSIVNSSYFNPSMEVLHPYSTIFSYAFYNFVDSVELKGFYVGPAQDTILPVTHQIFFENLSFTCRFNFFLNDSLMRKGYAFKYNIRAVDKGIIPQATTQPGVGSYYSVKYPPNGLSSEDYKEIDFNLLQNFPNPFNSETLISFSIPAKTNGLQSSIVSLKVFDLLGSVKAVLCNGELFPGNHKFRFTAEDLPSGVYFYELNIDGRKIIKKMILQK